MRSNSRSEYATKSAPSAISMRMRALSGGSLKNWRAAAITAGSISTIVCAARGRCLCRKRVSDAAPSPISSTLRGQRRAAAQQQRHHHVARVVELERVRPREPHRALDPPRSEVEVADALLLAHVDRRGHRCPRSNTRRRGVRPTSP